MYLPKIHIQMVSLFTGIMLALWIVPAFALENAYRYAYNANQGVRTSIVTSNPTLRGAGTWSYMRPFVQKIISGNVYYAEIGHYKDTGGQKVHWTYRDTTGSVHIGNISGATPGLGVAYNYQVKRTASNTWGLYFNNLGSGPNVTASVGWDTADDWASGGETPDTNQGMGSADNNNVAYINTSGTWLNATGSNNITNAIYHVDNGANSSSWKVYGNN